MGAGMKITTAQMQQCAEAGMTKSEAARALGTSPSSLGCAANILGIRFHRRLGRKARDHVTTTDAMLRKCAALRMSIPRTADELGVDLVTLRVAVTVLGIRFSGQNGCALNTVTLHRHAAHDPFGRLSA